MANEESSTESALDDSQAREYASSLVGSIIESFLSTFLSLSAILAALTVARSYVPFIMKVIMSIAVLMIWGGSIHFLVIYQFFQITVRKTNLSLVARIHELDKTEPKALNRFVLKWVEKVVFSPHVLGMTLDVLGIFVMTTVLFLACELALWL
jgi:uncharacterized RDD family membrane protein YckC